MLQPCEESPAWADLLIWFTTRINQKVKAYGPCAVRRPLTKFKFVWNLQDCEWRKNILKIKIKKTTGIPGLFLWKTKRKPSGKETIVAVAVNTRVWMQVTPRWAEGIWRGKGRCCVREQTTVAKYRPPRLPAKCKGKETIYLFTGETWLDIFTCIV